MSAFIFNFADFRESNWLCYFTVGAAVIAAGTALWAFKIHELGPIPLLAALVAHSVAVIVIFAGIYRGYGLLYSGACDQKLYTKLGELCFSRSSDWVSPLYFSAVTWTTLGYGDFTPPHELRLVAAAEAIFGYVFFGMVVGVATAVINRR